MCHTDSFWLTSHIQLHNWPGMYRYLGALRSHAASQTAPPSQHCQARGPRGILEIGQFAQDAGKKAKGCDSVHSQDQSARYKLGIHDFMVRFFH
jgi:hypothetical protein